MTQTQQINQEKINAGFYLDAIRKEWVDIAPVDFKEKLLDLPKDLRLETYKSIDHMISKEMLSLMVKRRQDLEEQGALRVYNKDTDTYQFEVNLDPVELIKQATLNILEEF